MKIGIIGPTKVEAREIIEKIAKECGDYDLVLTPDNGSTAELFAQEYKKSGGKKVVGVIPLEDKEFGYSWLNLEVIDEKVNCGTWRNQPETLDETVGEDGILICFGLSPGANIEVSYTKWFKVKKVYLIKELCDKLPRKTEEKISVEYISYSKLIKMLKNGKF